MGDAPGQYFDADPSARSRRNVLRLDLPDRSLRLMSDRGVFASAAIDAGTKYLLLEAPAPPVDGTFVDLGCGYGPIACTLAARVPTADVWAVDVNRRAVALCSENAVALGLTNLHAVHMTEVPDDLRVDLLWSNPPIRIGKTALHDLLTGWLARLTPTGSAVLVVQKHLGSDSLQRWLADEGWDVRRHGSRGGYRLLEVTQR